MTRDYNTSSPKDYSFAVKKAGMTHTVLNVGIGELVDVSPTWPHDTTYRAGSIQSRIENVLRWNRAHPKQKVTVHLRFHVGKSAPQAWKDLCGTVSMSDTQYPAAADAPRWWVTNESGEYVYRKLYENAMIALAQAVSEINAATDTKNIIGSVNAPGAAPNYPEPMLLYASSDEIRSNLLQAGFTPEEHDAFMLWFPSVAAHFNTVTVELAINPYQNLNHDGTGNFSEATATKYKQVSQALIDAVHSRAVLMSLSAKERYFDPKITKTDSYKQMYDWMVRTKKQKNIWIGVQMDRPPRVATTFSRRINSDTSEKWDDVAKWVAGRGFNFVETTGPGVSMNISGIQQSGKANIWPTSFNDDRDDIAAMQTINKALLKNPRPSY